MEYLDSVKQLLKENEEMIRKDTLGDDTLICSCCYSANHDGDLKYIADDDYLDTTDDCDIVLYSAKLYCDGKKSLLKSKYMTDNINDIIELTNISNINQFNIKILYHIIKDAFLHSGFKCCKKYIELFESYLKEMDECAIYPFIYEDLYLEYASDDLDNHKPVDDFRLIVEDHVKWIKENNPETLPYIFEITFEYCYTNLDYFKVLLDNGFKLTPEYIDSITYEYPGTISDIIFGYIFSPGLSLPDEKSFQKTYNPKILEVLDYLIDHGIKLKRFSKRQDILDNFHINEEILSSIMCPLREKLLTYLH